MAGIVFRQEPTRPFFESISVGSNTGLSAGITSPGMHPVMKLVYMAMMRMGRLEFTFAFALFAAIYALLRGRGGWNTGRRSGR